MSDTCQGTKANGDPCGATPPEGEEYCRHHRPKPDSEKVVEAEGKAIGQVEEKAIGVLTDVMEDARGPSGKCRAAEAALEHVRWREGQE